MPEGERFFQDPFSGLAECVDRGRSTSEVSLGEALQGIGGAWARDEGRHESSLGDMQIKRWGGVDQDRGIGEHVLSFHRRGVDRWPREAEGGDARSQRISIHTWINNQVDVEGSRCMRLQTTCAASMEVCICVYKQPRRDRATSMCAFTNNHSGVEEADAGMIIPSA